MSTRFQRGEPRPVTVPFSLAKSAAIGDLLATAASGGAGYKASEQTWVADTATTRRHFVERFAGASNQAKDANESLVGGAGYPLRIEAHTGGVWCYDSPASGTYLFGTLVGPAKNPDANALLDQTLEVVTDAREAIGYVVGGFGTNPAEIDVELLVATDRLPSARRPIQGAPTAKTTSATLTPAEMLTGIITGSQGASGAATYTLPTGALMQAALPAGFAVNDTFDFSVINISTTSGETVSLAAGTQFTIVGNASVAINSGQNKSSMTVRVRKTAEETFVAYVIG
jgi:hypothetical protein